MLTASEEWARIAADDPDREDVRTPGTTNILNDMISEALPPMEFSANATAEEVIAKVSAELGPAITRICAAFIAVHNEVATALDAEDPDRPAAQVLQDLAARADLIWPTP
ncbi:hypothetical protein [Streptomyces clavifer]|uniref:hypothetical protein n=1 Tax=Streptomyces clavifer TaxID=68188 RepID=UPI00381D8F95